VPLLQCLVLAAVPSGQSPKNSTVSQSSAPEASSPSSPKKDIFFSGAPILKSIAPGIDLVLFCDSSGRIYFNRFLILFLVLLCFFFCFFFSKLDISCVSIKEIKTKSSSSSPNCTGSKAIWCALIHSIYMNKPFLSFNFSFRNFKLMNYVGSFILITAVPVVSPIGAMPQNSSATHPVMPGESPSTLSGSTREKNCKFIFICEVVPLALNHSTSSVSMSAELCNTMNVSIESPWPKEWAKVFSQQPSFA
jgi:hypothetical protein